MGLQFRIKPHNVLRGTSMVEVIVDGEFAGGIYPDGDNGVIIISAHMEDMEIDEHFDGEVVYDDGSEILVGNIGMPQISITFNPGPYSIIDGRIVKLSSSEAG